jgi:hypothetical protein
MEPSRRAQRLGLTALLAALATLLATLTACAPFGADSPPLSPLSHAAIATMTAAASATAGANRAANATPIASLPRLSADPGWVVVAQVADGARLGGPEVIGGASGSSVASTTMTLGSFKLSSAALVRSMFACASPVGVHSAIEIGVDGSSDKIQCTPAGASTIDQFTLTPADAGRTLTVTATISTDSTPPQWNLLVEQPK